MVAAQVTALDSGPAGRVSGLRASAPAPFSNFVVTVGVRMDEELRSKRSRRLCRLGVRFLSLPPMFGTVAKKPKAAVRKTANRRCESGPCLL